MISLTTIIGMKESKSVVEMKSQLEKLSFLLGDWRGRGEMMLGKDWVHFEHRRRSRMTPDGSRLEILAFSDNPGDTMFNGKTSCNFVDSSSEKFRLRRQWFLDSGFAETTERVRVAQDQNSIELEGIPENSGSQNHHGTIRKQGDSELELEGEVIVGDRRLPYKTRLTRRVSKR